MRARLLGRAGVVALLAASAVLVPGRAGAVSVPSDPSAKGYIGFCDRTNTQITGGSVNAVPFVWKAVASQPPPSSYVGQGENALLSIYQLRPQVDPGDWSGEQLTAASYYTTPNQPAAIATTKDDSLAMLMHDFPPMDNGLYEVRMFFGKDNSGTYSGTYPATYIQVNGGTWSVVGGGAVDCAAAKSQSLEVLVGTVSAADSGGTSVPKGTDNLPSGTAGAGTPASSNTPQDGPVTPTSPSASPVAATIRHSSGGDTGIVVVLLVAAFLVVVLGGGGYYLRRRRMV